MPKLGAQSTLMWPQVMYCTSISCDGPVWPSYSAVLGHNGLKPCRARQSNVTHRFLRMEGVEPSDTKISNLHPGNCRESRENNRLCYSERNKRPRRRPGPAQPPFLSGISTKPGKNFRQISHS